MYQGETITTTISDLPVPVSEIRNLYIIFKQHSRVILEKTLADCSIDSETETIACRLTQEESLALPEGLIKRSIIAITNDGSRFESDPCILECAKTAKGEVIT